jgi:hypothetical protein
MATSGEFAELFAREFDMSPGQVHARGHELRAGGVIPTEGRGTAAKHLTARPLVAWMLALGMDPPRLEVAKHVKAALKLQRIDIESNHVFGDLSVATATNLGSALELLIGDAIAGRLQAFKSAHGPVVVDCVDFGRYFEVRAIRHEGGELAFKKPGTVARALSGFRVFRFDSRIFEQLGQILSRTETRDPFTGERRVVG